MTECEICGRTEKELSEEFGREIKVSEHEGMNKCQKCLSEYQRETGEEKVEDLDNELAESKDWKDVVTA